MRAALGGRFVTHAAVLLQKRVHRQVTSLRVGLPLKARASASLLLQRREVALRAGTMPLSREETVALGSSEGASSVWAAFYDLAQIPRMSRHEAAVLRHITALADELGLAHRSDGYGAGNLVVLRPGSGSQGAEAEPVIVQAHVDMVCERDDDSQHDFLQDRILFERAEEEEWLKAQARCQSHPAQPCAVPATR